MYAIVETEWLEAWTEHNGSKEFPQLRSVFSTKAGLHSIAFLAFGGQPLPCLERASGITYQAGQHLAAIPPFVGNFKFGCARRSFERLQACMKDKGSTTHSEAASCAVVKKLYRSFNTRSQGWCKLWRSASLSILVAC